MDLPMSVFATSSIDALIHAIESSLSPKGNSYTRMFGYQAIGMILKGYMQIRDKGAEARKPLMKEFLLASISHQRAKGYLLASLVLLFSSFIVKMNIYYVVVSSLLLILALISLLYKPKNINYNENVL